MKHARMRKCLKAAISALACLSVAASTIVGYAYRVDYAGGDADFSLSGKTSEAIAGQVVTVKVKNADTMVYTRQTETNSLGEYIFEFDVLDGLSGDLDITVNAGDAAETITVYKSTATEVSDTVSSVNLNGIYAATNGNAAAKKILQVADVAQNGALADYVDGNKPYAADSLEEFQSAYKNGLFLEELAKASGDDAELYALMEDSGMAELLTVNAGEEFATYDESEKTEVLGAMRGKKCTSDTAFKNALAESVIINELSKASTDNEKWAVLSANNDYLSGDPINMTLSKYEGLSKFTTFKSELFKTEITSLSSMKSNADSIYTRLNTKTDGGAGGSTSKGDRESVSVSSGLVTPSTTPVTFGFNDLAGYDWAKDAILTLAADGVINGKSQNVFAPGDNVTRAEFAKIIVGAFDLVDNSAAASFADTPKSHWSYRYVASAVAEKIVTGVSANSFNPDGKITRQDMATICYRALQSIGIETSTAGKVEFADASSISDYAKEAVDTLSGLGIINGKGNGRFAPNDFATRAEAAKIVHLLRALD